jgi:hypothetical protein
MRVTDDTLVPNWLMLKSARLVGAVRGAGFVVRRGEHDCDTVELYTVFPPELAADLTARRTADALRRFVVPCLVENREAAIEVPELASAGMMTFVLVFLARDATGVRGIAALVVEVRSRAEAERRLALLQDVMGGPHAPAGPATLPRPAAADNAPSPEITS